MPPDPAVEVLCQATSSRKSPRPATRMDGPHALPLACRYGARRMLALAVSLAWPFMPPDAALAQVRPDAGRIERDFERDRVPSAPPPKPAAPKPHPQAVAEDAPHPQAVPEDAPHPQAVAEDAPHPQAVPDDAPHPQAVAEETTEEKADEPAEAAVAAEEESK